jgi:hypothetical protein
LEKEQKPKYFANYLRGPSKITLNKSPVTQPKKKKKPIDIDTAAKRASDKQTHYSKGQRIMRFMLC